MATFDKLSIDLHEARNYSDRSDNPPVQYEEIRPWYSTFTGCCIAGKKWKKVLVHLQCGEQIVLDGTYILKPVIGSVDVLGYRFRTGEQQPVFSPRHQALLALSCGAHVVSEVVPGNKVCGCETIYDKVQFLQQKYFLTDQQVASLYLNPGSCGIVLELTPYVLPLQDLLFRCKMPSLYMNLLPLDKNGQEFSSMVANSNNFYSDELGPCAFHFPNGALKQAMDDLNLQDEGNQGESFSTLNGSSAHPARQGSKSAQNEGASSSCGRAAPVGDGIPPVRSCNVNECFTALRGAKPILASMEPSHIVNVPYSWVETVDDILSRVQQHELNWASEPSWSPPRPGFRILVVGARGVGKSTFLRYLVNSLLSFAKAEKHHNDGSPENEMSRKRKRNANDPPPRSQTDHNDQPALTKESCAAKSVCLLDLDCGQPEISLPGSVSVRRVSQPLLGPALIYGNSALKSDAEVDANLRKLRTRKAFLNQLKTKLNPPRNDSPNKKGKSRKSSTADDCSDEGEKSTNLAEVSMLQDIQEMIEELECETLAQSDRGITKEMIVGSTSPIFRVPEFLATVEELRDAVQKQHSQEPLVVNTMGWIRNEGLLILAEVLKIIQPVFVLHIVSDDNDTLDPMSIDGFYNSEIYINYSKQHRLKPASYVFRFDYNYFQIHAGSVMRKLRKKKYDVFQPSRIDLRHLRMISYFSSLWSPSSATSLCLQPCESLSFTRFGLHTLEREDDLFRCPGAEVPFELVCLCCTDKKNLVNVAEDLPLRYINHKSLSKRQKKPCSNKTANSKKEVVLPIRYFLEKYLVQPLPPLPENACMWMPKKIDLPPVETNYRRNTVTSELSTHKFPVLGWGILISIDRTAKKLNVLTPLSKSSLDKANLVVRSQMQLPISLKSVIVDDYSH